MSRRSDAPFERANKAKPLEVTLNAPLVLLNTGEDHACFFLRKQVNNRTGIRGTEYWVFGWVQYGNRRDGRRRHFCLTSGRSGSSFMRSEERRVGKEIRR